MVWYTRTNQTTGFIGSDVDLGCEVIVDTDFHCIFNMPYDDIAQDDQNLFLIANLSNGGYVTIRTLKNSSSEPVDIREIHNSASIHFMFDGTNEKWRIVSDDKIRSIEDEEHPLTALSGNKIKDQDGDLIEQSGVEVVGITSINGKTPLYTSDTIDADTVNGKTPVFSGDDVTLGEITADTITASTLSINNIKTDAVVCREIDNTTGAIYDAIDLYYGIPSAISSPKPINIVFVSRPGNYTYVRELNVVWMFGTGSYYVSGRYSHSQSSDISNFNFQISPTTAAPAWGSKFYLYA